jgi:hypothetical protein
MISTGPVRRAATILVFVVVALLGVASPARAHGDVPLVDHTLMLAPGETVTFGGELHYHRLTASIGADQPITVQLRDSTTGRLALDRGAARRHTINQLVACCDRGWAPHTLILHNVGDSAASVHASARLVHDDLAVMVYGAEPGTAESVVVLGAALLAVVWRAVRRASDPDRVRPMSLRAAAATLAVPVGVVLVVATAGAIRYGVGGPQGLVAGGADLPVLPVNPVVSRSALLLFVLMVGWGWAAARWAASRPLAPARAWGLLGLAVAGGPIATAVFVGIAYDTWAMPTATATAALLPVLAVWSHHRRSISSAPSGSQDASG